MYPLSPPRQHIPSTPDHDFVVQDNLASHCVHKGVVQGSGFVIIYVRLSNQLPSEEKGSRVAGGR